ncbi:unnamed protein product [Brachionus calyciflorus]|uniref:Uncharacterized protein n=1 Tax=Brachionus calyciflorus TaxID=104777 RepID=A0A814FC00_9BILA|nr:unnamed protein product [Brachionus calyciflorus]
MDKMLPQIDSSESNFDSLEKIYKMIGFDLLDQKRIDENLSKIKLLDIKEKDPIIPTSVYEPKKLGRNQRAY